MKEILKDFGTLIGPTFAFTLGVIAIYIKFYSDRQTEAWRSRKRLRKLIQMIYDSRPPSRYYPQKSKEVFMHADEARNLTNITIFVKRLQTVNSYIEMTKNDILTNGSVPEIRQFQDLKFIVDYLLKDVEIFRSNARTIDKEKTNSDFNYVEQREFSHLTESYERLITVCKNPEKEFNYIE